MIKFSHFLKYQNIIRRPDAPQSPAVTVVMPTCRIRPGKTNERAIQAVLGQTFKNFEFIIIDDGSVDDTFDLLKSFQSKDPRVVILRHDQNSGLPGLRCDEALLSARGKYAAYQFDDDGWEPACLESLLETMDQAGGNAFVFGMSMMEVRGKDGNTSYRPLGDKDLDFGELLHNNLFANNSILHPLSAFDVCGMYDPHILMRRLCDYDLWLRMTRCLPVHRCPAHVSTVYAEQPHSLGTTVDYHLFRTRTYMQRDRNRLLTPSKIPDYEIDNLDYVQEGEERDRIKRTIIKPFMQRYAGLFDESIRSPIGVSSPVKKRILIAKKAYSTAIDVVLGHFLKAVDPGVYAYGFLGEGLLHLEKSPDTYDLLCLFKTVDKPGLVAAKRAQALGKPVFYALDDNYLRFAELGKEFDYLKPGAARYNTMIDQMKTADVVISFNSLISKDCLEVNPRVLELHQVIPGEFIRSASAPQRKDGKIRYLINTGPARREELQALWNVITDFIQKHVDEVELHCWGFDPGQFGKIPKGTVTKGFNNCYEQYLSDLRQGEFDYVICPLFDDSIAKKSKSIIKYLEATSAGAVGIYSDSFPYRPIQEGVQGFKAENTPEAWREALEKSFELPVQDRHKMLDRAKEHVLKEFSLESWFFRFASAFEAGLLHSRLRSREMPKGRAKIAYFFHETVLGGASLHLLQHALIAKKHGFEPILCVRLGTVKGSDLEKLVQAEGMELVEFSFDFMLFAHEPMKEEIQRAKVIAEYLKREEISMVHVAIYNASALVAAQMAAVPCVITLHKHYEMAYARELGLNIQLPEKRPVTFIHSSCLLYAKEWSEELKAPSRAIPCPIPEKYFDQYEERKTRKVSRTQPTLLISGTLQKRKGQLLSIEALLKLREKGLRPHLRLLGYDTLRPDYVETCREFIKEHQLEDQVEILGFALDPEPIYAGCDYLLCASDEESMPQTILKAMASGMRVISTPIAGVPEVIRDGFSGVLSNGYQSDDLAEAIERAIQMTDEQWSILVYNAHETAKTHCHHEVVAYELLSLYNEACRCHQGRSDEDWQTELANLRSHLPVLESVLEIYNEPDSTAYIYRVADDQGEVIPNKPLPEGWSEAYHSQLGTHYWWHDGKSDQPLCFQVRGKRIDTKMLANPKTKSLRIMLAGVERQIDMHCQRSGGKWREEVFWPGELFQAKAQALDALLEDPTSQPILVSEVRSKSGEEVPPEEKKNGPEDPTKDESYLLLSPGQGVHPSPPLRSRRVYRILPTEDAWNGISVLCGTHQRSCKGMLSMTLYVNGENIRRVQMDLESVSDNYLADLFFAPIQNSRGKEFRLVFEVDYRDPESLFSLYEYVEPEKSFSRKVRHRLFHEGGKLHCYLHYHQ